MLRRYAPRNDILSTFRLFLSISCLFVAMVGTAYGQDWPTYMHDNSRSGVTPTQLELPLKPAWTFQPLHPPAPAWPGPAKQDFFHRHYDLRPLETYDHAFQAIAADGMVYFGSSAQDKIYALDAASGAVRWTHLTEGPVRFAPTLSGGRTGADPGGQLRLHVRFFVADLARLHPAKRP